MTGQVLASDNVLSGNGERQPGLVFSVTPDFLLSLDTARVLGRIFYAPSLRLYTPDSDQSRLDHRANGSVFVTLVPQTLFLDLRGSANVQSITGGTTGDQESSLPRRDRAQSLAFSATPYGLVRFGGLATALAGYTFQYSSLSGTSRSLEPGGLPFFTPQEFTSHTGFASVRTGEDFGRLAMEARVTGTAFTGDGVLDGAHRALGEVEVRYAVLRGVSVLATGGYENQEYAGTPGFRLSGPVWGVGVRLDPSPDTVIMAQYQHRDGYNSPYINARVSLGARTTLFASYADALTTAVRRVADLLTTTDVDELGNPRDTLTGSPTSATFGSSFGSSLALQNGLFRVRRAALSLNQTWERDSITLSFSREKRTPISTTRGNVAFEQESDSVILSWSHALSPVTTLIASAQYGTFESSALRNNGDFYTGRATIAHRINERVTASLQYQISNRFTDLADRDERRFGRDDQLQNAVIFTIRQRF
ncbi:TIGR03016 family PEP-CTERM system-associated outer membrane protein [Roseomonas sp. SSH11]|uniref:TIGR03016 family PEP-CTERM system-associated outer membrane protein n=1 Tax=Pararoseomonas baculiformis TaxID=2820812 RepID=A0ABS4ADP7_9PROT|nr:TIGR03016 family PEP-CTERM system-associated outer membrane protein [Pararoseomonas baculiformis]